LAFKPKGASGGLCVESKREIRSKHHATPAAASLLPPLLFGFLLVVVVFAYQQNVPLTSATPSILWQMCLKKLVKTANFL
jgi:hypothetical protein